MTQKLEEARKLYQTANADQRYVLESLFPELKDEDEKWIPIEIEKYLKEKGGFRSCWISWLERQCKNELKDYIDAERNKKSFYYCGKEVSWNEMPLDVRKHDYPCYFNGDLDYYPFNAENNVEKQSEQKSTIEMKSAEESLGIDSDTYNEIVDECIYGKQKPTDKVEPKFKVGDKIQYSKGCGTIMTIEKIENGEYIFANNMGHTTIESGNKWYLVEQKPAWSEEDDRMLRDVISYAEHEISFKNTPQLNWLKSLRPRFTWKPSDEQIEALKGVVQEGVFRFGILESLYNDLMKLKGE